MIYLYGIKSFVNFGAATPELTGLICELLVHGKNWYRPYLAEYLTIYWTDFYYLLTI